ncbi:MAG: DUF4328 domain-containing protein [Pseudomonadota bacterium]|nr:DUF4328 domain-containing protein [Pseudomonadota bacterium]
METMEFAGADAHAEASDGGFARLKSRARNAGYAIIAYIGISAVMLVFEVLALTGQVNLYAMVPETLAVTYGFAAIAYLLIFLVSVVLVSMWIYRAHANLKERGIETESSPGMAVGWYFIPFANLIKPFQNMRDLWNESHLESDSYGEPAPGLINAWWACWIIGSILSNISARMEGYGDGSNMVVANGMGAVSSVLLIACAVMLHRIIRQITHAQDTALHVSQVFD